MLEYIVIGVLVVVLAVLIYQKLGSKNEISLSDIKERLGIIENAQKSIETLNEKIIDFENIFNNKTKRGKLGEEYLEDIVKDTLIEKHYKFQHTLTNNKRVDCLLKFGSTNENICIDSKDQDQVYAIKFQGKPVNKLPRRNSKIEKINEKSKINEILL